MSSEQASLIKIINVKQLQVINSDKVSDIFNAVKTFRNVAVSSYTYGSNSSSSASELRTFIRAATSDIRYYEIGSNEAMIAFAVGTDVLSEMSKKAAGQNVTANITDEMYKEPVLIARGFSLKDGSILFEIKEKNFNDLLSYLKDRYGFTFISAVHLDRFWKNNDPTNVLGLYLVEYIVSCPDKKTLVRVYRYSPGADTSKLDFLDSASNVELVGEVVLDNFLPGSCNSTTQQFYPSMLNNGLPYLLLRPANETKVLDEINSLKDKFVCDVDSFIDKLKSVLVYGVFIERSVLLYVDLKSVGSGKFLNLVYGVDTKRTNPIPFFSDGRAVTVLAQYWYAPNTATGTTSQAAQQAQEMKAALYVGVQDDTKAYVLLSTGIVFDGVDSIDASSLLIGNLLMAPVYEGSEYPRFAVFMPSGVETEATTKAYVVIMTKDCSGKQIECVSAFDATEFVLADSFINDTIGWERSFASRGGTGYILVPALPPLTYGPTTPTPIASTDSIPLFFGGGADMVVEVLSDRPKNIYQRMGTSMNVLPLNYPAFSSTFGALTLDSSNAVAVGTYKLVPLVEFPPAPRQEAVATAVQEASSSNYATKDEVVELELKISSLNSAVSQLSSKLSSIESEISSLQQGQSSLQKELESVLSSLKSVEDEISKLKEELESAEDKLGSLSDKVSNDIEPKLKELEGEVAELEKRVSSLYESVSSLEEEVEAEEAEEERWRDKVALGAALLVALAGMGAVFISRRGSGGSS